MTVATDILLVTLFLGGMALLGVVLFAVTLRVGPRRGFLNQPAAALTRPGRRVRIGLWLVALLHVIIGLVCGMFVPGWGTAMLILLIVTGSFYALCACSYGLATRVVTPRPNHLD